MSGLTTTFDLFANTDNEAAAAVLVSGLDASQREVRDLAFTALLARRNAAAELNVLRRWADMSLRWKQQLAERPGWLSAAIRTAVVNREPNLYECGCQAAVFTREYDSIPLLTAAATDKANPYAARAATAALELTEQLADELAGPRDYRIRRDPQLQRTHVLACLEKAVAHLDDHRHANTAGHASSATRELLEAFLLLANRENAVLKRILQSPTDRGFAPLIELLTNSSRPGIERLLLSYLDDPHAPLAALQVIGRRGDISFLRLVAKKIGAEPTPTIRNNLRRIESLPWITGNVSILDALREAEQPGVVHLAVASSAPRHRAFQVVSYILMQGTLGGRRVAADALAEFVGPEANDLAVRLMDDDDSQVRAAAARQLRPRNVPGAIQRLLDLLESSHEVERKAAQEGLVEFTFERYAANFDQLTPEARSIAGALVRRVDPHAVDRIRAEIDAPSRGRKKRALELALALDTVEPLLQAIVGLLKDEDQYLRIDAIRTLATIDTPVTRKALRDAMLDAQPLVQQAAEVAMRQLTNSDTVAALADETGEAVRLTVLASQLKLPIANPAVATAVGTAHPTAAEAAT